MVNLKLVWCLPGTEFEIPFERIMQKLEGTWHLIILLGVTPEPQTSNLKTSNLKGEGWPGKAPQHCKPILPHVPLPALLPRGGRALGVLRSTRPPGWTKLGANRTLRACKTLKPSFPSPCDRPVAFISQHRLRRATSLNSAHDNHQLRDEAQSPRHENSKDR